MQNLSALKIIKGPLVAVLAGVGLNIFFNNGGSIALTAEQMVSIPVPESLGGFFGQFVFPDFSKAMDPKVLTIAITLAVVASLETLLCVEATDKLDPQKRITPTNRELTAQGIGNIVSGMIGGLPITQVIVRSSANIQSGGKTKASAFFHGLLLLICVMTIPALLNLIPLASLAAILFIVGYKLAKPALFKQMYNAGKGQFIPYIVTILGIVFTDLLMGIGLGLVVAIVQILWNNYEKPYHFESESLDPNAPIRIKLSEDVSFLNKASMLRTLDNIPDHATVIIDGRNTTSIHPDILEIFEDFKSNATTKGINFSVEGLSPGPKVDPVKNLVNAIAELPELYSNKEVLEPFGPK